MMRSNLALALLGILVNQTPPSSSDKPLALVLVVKGNVEVKSGDARPVRLLVGRQLSTNDRIVVQPGSEARVIFRETGRCQRLKPIAKGETIAPSEISVTPDGCTPSNVVETIEPRQMRITFQASPLLPNTRPGAVIARGNDESQRNLPPAITPFWNAVVITNRPEFSWPCHPGARAYRIRLVDASGRTLWERGTDRCKLHYPGDEKPMELTRHYIWRVSACGGEKVIPVVTDASFDTIPRLPRTAIDRR